jgi:hypothetical protein
LATLGNTFPSRKELVQKEGEYEIEIVSTKNIWKQKSSKDTFVLQNHDNIQTKINNLTKTFKFSKRAHRK